MPQVHHANLAPAFTVAGIVAELGLIAIYAVVALLTVAVVAISAMGYAFTGALRACASALAGKPLRQALSSSKYP